MNDLTIRDRIGIRWSQLLSWYYAGYNWSMNIRIKRQMKRDNQELEKEMQTEEIYTKMGRKVLELTIQAHPFKAKMLKPALSSDAACAMVGKDWEKKVLASDDLKLREEYNMIMANILG